MLVHVSVQDIQPKQYDITANFLQYLSHIYSSGYWYWLLYWFLVQISKTPILLPAPNVSD